MNRVNLVQNLFICLTQFKVNCNFHFPGVDEFDRCDPSLALRAMDKPQTLAFGLGEGVIHTPAANGQPGTGV
jgi:hypothetical protein